MATIDELKQNPDFVKDAKSFLYERTGKYYRKPEDVVDAFFEQRRKASINELDLIGDIEYAQKASDESAERFGRLIDEFDNTDADFSWDATGDYLEGAVTSPLTVGASLVSFGLAGAGKTALQLGAGNVASQAIKQNILKRTAQAVTQKAMAPTFTGGAARAAVTEGLYGYGMQSGENVVRRETGLEEEDAVVAGLSSAAIAAPIGGLLGRLGKAADTSAGELAQEAQKASDAIATLQKNAVAKARKEAVEGVAEAIEGKKPVKSPLDPERVKQGDALLEELNENKDLSARLRPETREAVTMAAAEVASRIEMKPNQRITEAIADAIVDGKIDTDSFKKILDKFHITKDQFATVYMADISNAARTLGKQSMLKQHMARMEKALTVASMNDMLDITAKEIKDVIEVPSKVGGFIRGLDAARLAVMTSQLATTVRNTAGGGLRVMVDGLEEALDTVVGKAFGTRKADVSFNKMFSTQKFMLYQHEARVIQEMFMEQMPTKAQRLFFNAADAEAKLGSNNVFAAIGHKMNFLNTISDNMFKRAAFSGSLDRQLHEAGMGGIIDMVKAGKFSQIPEDIIKKAIDDSLDLVYQKMPSEKHVMGELGHGLIRMHRAAPFVVSSFIPFPRFIINQMRFVYEHAPLLPLFGRATGFTPAVEKQAAKQISGTMMLIAAYQWRMSQPDDTKWNIALDSKQNQMDLTPILGPFAPFMLAGDLLARVGRGEDVDSLGKYVNEAVKTLGAPRVPVNSGFGLVDRLYNDALDGKAVRAVGRFVGEAVSTYTLPVSMYRDFLAITDEDQRYVREMDQYLPSEGDAMLDLWTYIKHYSSRYMPIAPEEAERMVSATAGELQRIEPFSKQLTGLAKYKPATALERELTSLGMDRKLSMGNDPDPVRNSLNKRMIYNVVRPMLESYIKSDTYRNLSRDQKKYELNKMITRAMNEGGVKKAVDAQMTAGRVADKPLRYSHINREKYEELDPTTRKMIDSYWTQTEAYRRLVRAYPYMKDATISEAGAYDTAIELLLKNLRNK